MKDYAALITGLPRSGTSLTGRRWRRRRSDSCHSRPVDAFLHAEEHRGTCSRLTELPV